MNYKLLLLFFLVLPWSTRAQTLLQQPSFEGTGNDALAANGYTANPFCTAVQPSPFVALSYFQRQPLSASVAAYPGTTQPLTNQPGSFAWTAESVRGDGVATRPPGYVQLNDCAASNYKNLRMTVAFGAPRGGSFAGAGGNQVRASDRIGLQYAFDGGPWVTAGLLMGNNAVTPGSPGSRGDFQQITNLSDSVSIENGNAPAGNSPVLDQRFRDISATISGSGTTLRARLLCDFYNVELAFATIRVTGDVDIVPKPPLAGLALLPRYRLPLLPHQGNVQRYCLLNDGALAATLDEPRRTPLSATEKTTLPNNLVESPGLLGVNLANNGSLSLVARVRNTTPRVVAIRLMAPYQVSRCPPINYAATGPATPSTSTW